MTNTTKKDPHPRLIKRSGWRSLFFVAALILTMGFTLTSLFQQPSGDNLSDSRKRRIADDFSKVASMQLETIPAAEVKSAIDSMGLDQEQRAILENVARNSNNPQLDPSQANTVKMMWLELWDFASQDADSVSISSAGYQATFPLLKAPVRIAIPVDANLAIRITGVHDGGGGITLGVKNGQSQISLPVLAPGQTIQLPVML